jgi:CheY-like chemotaxis protein
MRENCTVIGNDYAAQQLAPRWQQPPRGQENPGFGGVSIGMLIFYRHGLAALLRASRPGWSLAEVGSCAARGERLHLDPAKLVLVDLELPGMGRLDDLRRLRHPEHSAQSGAFPISCRA